MTVLLIKSPQKITCTHTLYVSTYGSGQPYIFRVGQNRIYTPYMTVYLVISLPKIPYVDRVYMVLANPIHISCFQLAMTPMAQILLEWHNCCLQDSYHVRAVCMSFIILLIIALSCVCVCCLFAVAGGRGALTFELQVCAS